MTDKKKAAEYSPRRFVVLGYLTIFLAFGVLGGWAATAPLDSAVVAGGVLSVESSKKIVDHYEGGIVKEILVKDSQHVKQGQVLLRLSQIKSQANAAMIDSRLKIAWAELSRLEAERSNSQKITFREDLVKSSDTRVKFALKAQSDLFRDRVSVRDSQIDILHSRVEQLRQQISGLTLQKDAVQKELKLIDEEVDRLQDGTSKGVVSTNRLSSLLREEAQLSGTYGKLVTEIARVKENVSETELDIVRIRQSFSERAATELQDVRQQLAELEEQTIVAADVLERTEIRAQVDGIVQNLQVHTIGAVVRPGQPIMEIIPSGDNIVINARIRTMDVDNIHSGMSAEVKISSFTDRYLPLIIGDVEYISPDTIEPKNPNQPPYYQARIVVPEDNIPEQMKGKLQPGMPAEIIIPTGERTLVEYLVAPLENAVRKSLRE
jgi:HlyD family secretion protein